MATKAPYPDPDEYKLETRFSGTRAIHRSASGLSWWLWGVGLGGVEKWERVRDLGQGGQGIVYLEREVTTLQLRAVKRLSMHLLKSQGLSIKRELHTLISVKDHQDLFVQFFGWYEDGARDSIFIAMEYVKHGDLGKYLKDLGSNAKKHAKEITKQLLKGLKILHERQICHRDLKPQNVLIARLSPIHVKLADFGVSKSTINTRLRTICGTFGYLAPELRGFRPPNYLQGDEHTFAVDMWALGCLVHEILTLEIPFSRIRSDSVSMETDISGIVSMTNDSPPEVDMACFSQFCAGNIDFPIENLRNSGADDHETDFVKRLLAFNPESRMSAGDSLNHKWIFPFPGALLPGNSPETIRAQLMSLGLSLDVEAVNELLLACRQQDNVDIRRIFPPTGIAALRWRAAANGFTLVLEMLFSFEPTPSEEDIDFRDSGWTALQAAARGGHLDAVKLLLGEGARVNAEAVNRDSRTALQAAAEGGHLEVLRLLLEKGAEVNAEPAPEGQTALQAAAKGGHLEVLRLLLEKGAEVNAKPAYWNGRTALQAAAEGGHLEVLRLLLEKGAEVNAGPAFGGWTALQAAAEGGHLEVLRLLLEKGAEVNAEPATVYGQTALNAAKTCGNPRVLELLLKKGVR